MNEVPISVVGVDSNGSVVGNDDMEDIWRMKRVVWKVSEGL